MGTRRRAFGVPCGCDPAVLGEVSAERVGGRGALPDEQLSDAEGAGLPLRFLVPHRHETHVWSLHCFADRLGVSRIIFPVLDEGLHVGGRDEADVVARLCQFPPPEMRTVAGLHRHRAGRQPGEELKP